MSAEKFKATSKAPSSKPKATSAPKKSETKVQKPKRDVNNASVSNASNSQVNIDSKSEQLKETKKTTNESSNNSSRSTNNSYEQDYAFETEYDDNPEYIEDEYYDDEPYQVGGFEQDIINKEIEEQKSNEANAKGGKVAAQAVATYFGGSAGNAIVGAINDSGIADPIYDKIGKRTRVLNKILPGGRTTQALLNKLDEEGLIDKASDVVNALGSKGKSAGKTAGTEAAKQTAKKKGIDETKKQVAKKASTENKTVPKSEINKQKRVKENHNNTITSFILKHPLLCLALVGGGFLFIIIILLIVGSLGGAAGEGAEQYSYYMDPTYDFNETLVKITNGSQGDNKRIITNVTLEDYILGVAYSEVYKDVANLTAEEKIEVYKAFIIVAKSLALAMGSYDNTTKEIELHSGSKGLPYCDVYNGCDIYNNGGIYTYTVAGDTSAMGTLINKYDAMPSEELTILQIAYNAVENQILTPEDFSDALTSYTFGTVSYNSTIKNEWINLIKDGLSYDEALKSTDEYKNWKIYNLTEYAMQYHYAEGTSYWWPIGGSTEKDGVYSGTPTTTSISSKFGWRTVQGNKNYHKGIDIAGACNKHVVIAVRGGVVKKASNTCDSYGSYGNGCGGGFGNYVYIEHSDGSISIYAHMFKDSIVVNVGDTVVQGQKIGMIGSSGSSTGCHLHFQMEINKETVDPLNYISVNNPRPAGNIADNYVSGQNNMQSVCLSLKQSGFSDNAVSAILVNMHAESGFKTTALGDSGTSYGLCQWHNGRYNNLKNYCGDKVGTVECQLSYLIHELQNSYVGVFSYLQTNNSAWDMAKYYCMNFEIPANREISCSNRANNYAASYEAYVKNGCS